MNEFTPFQESARFTSHENRKKTPRAASEATIQKPMKTEAD